MAVCPADFGSTRLLGIHGLPKPCGFPKSGSGGGAGKHRGKGAKQVSQVLLGDIPEFKNREKFRKFTLTFEKWVQEML